MPDEIVVQSRSEASQPSIWIIAAQMARENAHTRRKGARIWAEAGRSAWAREYEVEALKAFERARWYLSRARLVTK